MGIFRFLAGILLLLLLLPLGQAQNLAPVPALSARVMDQASMLNPTQAAALENVLKEYETRTGNQIAVLLINSTAPEVIEQYSIRVADAWKLGRKGIDDGVILVVAKDNPKDLRRLRIESGRGVQGVLTDAQSKRILQDVIAPHFRQNDYYGGLVAGVAAITGLLDQEHFAAPAKAGAAQASDGFALWPLLLFAFLVVIAFKRSRGGPGSTLNRGNWGRSSGIILGSAAGSSWGRGGGFGSGGGSSGGGFSGGGGGFDGGGASGDW